MDKINFKYLNLVKNVTQVKKKKKKFLFYDGQLSTVGIWIRGEGVPSAESF